jgi:uncharacterized repeat protein (TIGR01451 family)
MDVPGGNWKADPSMRRGFVGILILIAAAAGSVVHAGAPAAQLTPKAHSAAWSSERPTNNTSRCRRGSVRALVGGHVTCLQPGKPCKRKFEPQYRSHGFHCQAGHLVRLPASADLSVTNTPHPTSVQVGTSITSTIVVKNKGPSAATNVVVVQTLDADMHAKTFTGGSSGTTCSRSADIGGRTTCRLGTIRSGKTVRVLLTNTPMRPGSAEATTATVRSSTRDPKRANNSSVATSTVRGEPAPLVFSGNGSAVTDVALPLDGPLVATGSYTGTDNFIVKLVAPTDTFGTLLFNEIALTAGTTLNQR